MKCFLITMYKEFKTVQATVNIIKNFFQDSVVYAVQSNDLSGRAILGVDDFKVLENLEGQIKPYKLAAHAITRNYSILFGTAYQSGEDYDFIIGLTGDTLVTDPSNFLRLYDKMCVNNKVLCCSQAIGQNFHSVDSDPENGRCGGRIQYEGISDFMPQFFMVRGDFATKTKVFSEIKITNEYTSEQCLGDEFTRHIQGNFLDNAHVIASNAYSYSDGIRYQVRES